MKNSAKKIILTGIAVIVSACGGKPLPVPAFPPMSPNAYPNGTLNTGAPFLNSGSTASSLTNGSCPAAFQHARRGQPELISCNYFSDPTIVSACGNQVYLDMWVSNSNVTPQSSGEAIVSPQLRIWGISSGKSWEECAAAIASKITNGSQLAFFTGATGKSATQSPYGLIYHDGSYGAYGTFVTGKSSPNTANEGTVQGEYINFNNSTVMAVQSNYIGSLMY